jgi:hypothetical protein
MAADGHLATYLQDHLAGAEAAVELLEHLEKARAETGLASWAGELRADVEADRQELEALMDRLHVAASRPRQAFAWLGEKVTGIKLWVDDPRDGGLRLLESLEALALGIEGKGALWRSLAAAAQAAPTLQGVDYDRLERRAEDQRRRVEGRRLEAARDALAAS